MDISAAGKSPNTSLSFRYNANNEEIEELFDVCDDAPPSPPFDASPTIKSETESPKKVEKTPSIIDKYFKSMRSEKSEKSDEKLVEPHSKPSEEIKPPKDVQSSPMKEYLKSLGKRNTSEPGDVKEGANETWKIFHDFKFKIAQAVEDMKTRSGEEIKEKSVPRDSSISDSEENSVVKDSDHSVGDTDNQVSSIESSIQNLSEISQPVTAKATEREATPSSEKNNSDSSDDTHKNLYSNPGEAITDGVFTVCQFEVESGVEALEDGIDGFSEVNPTSDATNSIPPEPLIPAPPNTPLKTSFRLPPSNSSIGKPSKNSQKEPKAYIFNFTMYFITFLVIINYILFRDWTILNGFMLGVWFYCFIGNLKEWFIHNFMNDDNPRFVKVKRSSATPFIYTIPSVKEHRPVKKFEGWVNHYRFPSYDPFTYHLNKTTTAFMKLEGCNLRISYTKTKISKRAFWDEKFDNKVEFYQHRLYNLTGARVILLPDGLVRRRTWSKKYPICIILSQKEKIQVLEKESAAAERRLSEQLAIDKRRDTLFEIDKESAETNTITEKKRKFVWRRKDKSNSHVDTDSGKESSSKDFVKDKEGLRHRLVRKMHRDKKADYVSTSTEPEAQNQADKNMQFEDLAFHDAEMEPTKSATSTKDDGTEEDLDENEMTRIKEFLEEAELETGAQSTSAEGEWSIHVKRSYHTRARLFFFARTGRDKHEWFRRLQISIEEANEASPEPSSTQPDDKQSSDSASDSKEVNNANLYKLVSPDAVSYSRASRESASRESRESRDSDRVHLGSSTAHLTGPPTIGTYEATFWPYLLKIIQSKEPGPCDCRSLPSEMSWLNTVAGRIAYDVMRNKAIIAKMQTRIQKKLHTIKLPSFMSPLVVTDLNLEGACPLFERVSAPSWDERGVWLDADLRYDGGGYISVLTQINLMKLKEKNLTLEEQLLEDVEMIDDNEPSSANFLSTSYLHKTSSIAPKRKFAPFDSEVEDSAESSSDDEMPLVQPIDSSEDLQQPDSSSSGVEVAASSSKKKFLRVVDRIASNKYFQQVTDYKYVKRAMEGLSNTDIKLQLEVLGLEGRLVVNLPPPPHDRVWIGFRSNPQLVLKARPAVGARTLRFGHISNWIEQRLSKEFEKVLVMPNMEDIIVDALTPTPIEFD